MKHQTATRDDLEDAFQAAIDSADATEPEQGGKRRPFERPTRNFAAEAARLDDAALAAAVATLAVNAVGATGRAKELIGAQAQVYAAEMKRRKVRK